MNLAWILLFFQVGTFQAGNKTGPSVIHGGNKTCPNSVAYCSEGSKPEPMDVPAVQVLAASTTDYRMRLGSATVIGDDHGYCTYYSGAGGGFCYERRGNRAMFRSWGDKNFVINYVDDYSITGNGYLPSPQSTLFMLDWEIRHQ